MKLIALIPIVCIAYSCTKAQENFRVVTDLPKEVKEASACQISTASPLIWTVEDSNNQNFLFGVDTHGKLIKKIRINNVENNDWEDLATDEEGNIYIGDFGNNDNDRQNLAIYKIDAEDLNQDEANASAIIKFYYPEQSEFPPKKKNKIFDCEAFFFYNNRFYLVTKNRSSKFDGTTYLYEVENNPHKLVAAKKIGSFVTCDHYNHCAITSADISPNKDKMAILSSDKVWVFSQWKDNNFFSGKVEKYELGHFSQKEGLCFKDQQTLYITDEREKKQPGNYLYELRIK